MEGGKKTSLTATFGNYNMVFSPSNALFSPGSPPVVPDPQPPRLIDFPSGVNLQWTPRAYEPFGFQQLRAFANTELVRLAIETRKDQLEKIGWSVKSRKRRKARSDADERIRAAERLLRKPDGATHFATWFRMLAEDLLVIDAPAIERRRTRSGKLIGLDVIDGATIKVLVDRNGRRPIAPAPSYQQVIKGRIWCDLTTDDLIYAPRNMRTSHLYGFGPVEQIIVTINIALRRQTAQLSYFSESNLPAGILNAPDGWSADQIKEFQTWFDARLAGNLSERSKVIWTPKDSKYSAFKDAPLKDEFDEWLARVVCFAFSLPPTPFIRQMNRSTAEEDQDRALEEGLHPLLGWGKRIFDGVIQDDLGFSDLEFVWDQVTDLDPKTQAEIDDKYVRNGTLSLNEVRDNLGRDAVKGGEEPMVYLPTGPVPLSMIAERAELANKAAANAATAQADDDGADNGADDGDDDAADGGDE